MPPINISSDSDASLISLGSKSIIFFWANWHPSSSKGGAFDTVFNTLAKDAKDVKFYRVEAEEALGVSKKVSYVALVLLVIESLCSRFVHVA